MPNPYRDPTKTSYKGVCHKALPEEGHCRPGEILLGTDSHTCTAGRLRPVRHRHRQHRRRLHHGHRQDLAQNPAHHEVHLPRPDPALPHRQRPHPRGHRRDRRRRRHLPHHVLRRRRHRQPLARRPHDPHQHGHRGRRQKRRLRRRPKNPRLRQRPLQPQTRKHLRRLLAPPRHPLRRQLRLGSLHRRPRLPSTSPSTNGTSLLMEPMVAKPHSPDNKDTAHNCRHVQTRPGLPRQLHRRKNHRHDHGRQHPRGPHRQDPHLRRPRLHRSPPGHAHPRPLRRSRSRRRASAHMGPSPSDKKATTSVYEPSRPPAAPSAPPAAPPASAAPRTPSADSTNPSSASAPPTATSPEEWATNKPASTSPAPSPSPPSALTGHVTDPRDYIDAPILTGIAGVV